MLYEFVLRMLADGRSCGVLSLEEVLPFRDLC